MRILVVSHRFPFPPKRGGKIRPFNLIAHLHKSHEVYVASIAHDKLDFEAASGIRDYCCDYLCEKPNFVMKWIRMLMRIPTLIPSAMGFFYSPNLKRRLKQLVHTKNIDLIIVHCAFVAPYVSDLPAKKILDFGDMDSQKWRTYAKFKPFPLSLAFGLEGWKMEKVERALAEKFDACSATTQLEHEDLVKMGTARLTTWFPNGVDHQAFRPGDGSYRAEKIVFVGRMDYFPNQQGAIFFASNVLPLVREAVPNAQFYVVGANPPDHVKALAKHEGIVVTGTVQDVREHVADAALTVAPLAIARGVQNKVLESMALGVPVVASSQAAKGVNATAPEHLLVADDSRQFADAVIKIMTNRSERLRLSLAGRSRVVDAHDWKRSMERLDALIEQVV